MSMNALEDLVSSALSRQASLPAIEFERRWFNWGELRHVADRVGALIEDSGAAQQAPVAFVPRNRPSAIAALLGLIARRRTVRMIYAFQSPAALARDIGKLGASILVAAGEDLSEEVRAVLREQGSAAVAIGEMGAAALEGFERVRHPAGVEGAALPRIEILTSGTTGPPKQFAVSYELVARHHVGTPASAGIDPSQLPPTVLFFPLGNISGIYATLPPLIKGQRAVLLERFSVAGWHDYVLRFRPEATGLPPAGVQMVLDAAIPPADLACIRRLGTGAAPLDPSVHRAFEERYGIPILLSYGATEFGGPVTAMTAELHAEWGGRKFGSVGRVLPGAKLRVIDSETGGILPPGREGLLEVVSPRIGPEWLRTSDIAVIDEDGFLFHRGRADGAIMRGGFKVLPETIERALLLHPAISAAAVAAVPDQRLGQVPAAAVQFKPGVVPPAVDQLEAHLRQHVLATHIPVTWRFVEALPRTPSLKVDRPALQRLFESQPAAGFYADGV
jgi:acyl-coenzyme A synthetase/AMP-(fatty) acid ligase